ncbi:MAG TPA: adenylosuccinate lyase [Candidatus Dormibacteraeota bacterium]|nr:adenylosuccinate lyase [Candidatus Dormibacteraeota bacterium]
MIERYAPQDLQAIWAEAGRLAAWLRVEVAAAAGMAAIGVIPAAALPVLRAAAVPSVARVRELEAEQGHDLAAFVSAVQETLGPEGRFLHLGLTSQDVVDTALALQLVAVTTILLSDADALLQALATLAVTHRATPMVGRTHGMHAEPVTFGFVVANHYDELRRCRDRLAAALPEVAVGRIRGPVGTYGTVDPRVEAIACAELGIPAAVITTQVVARDRHAGYVAALAILAAAGERLATSVRHWQRTEVGEALEPFGAHQKGSSAMPHKRNPIGSEQVCGLSRLLRGYAVAALEDVALWHERDISHSSTERVILPDATMALGHILRTLRVIVAGLEVRPQRMRQNLDQGGGLVYSQRVLLALVAAGLSREEAYRTVQRLARPATEGQGHFRDAVAADPDVAGRLSPAALAACFDPAPALAHIDLLLERVGLLPAAPLAAAPGGTGASPRPAGGRSR